MSAAVEGVVGRRLFGVGRCDMTVQGRIDRVPHSGELAATVNLVDRDGAVVGSRRLQGGRRSCEALGGPVSLVIALMIEAGQTHVVLAVPPEVHEQPKPSRGGTAWTGQLSASVIGSWGVLPRFAVGQGLGIGIRPSRFVPLLADATLFWPAAFEQAGRGGTFWAWHAGLSLCPDVLSDRTRAGVALCLGLRAGAVNGTGVGLDYQQSASRPYAHSEAKIVGSWPLIGPLAIHGQLGLAVPLVRPRFVYLDSDGVRQEVFQPAHLAAFGGVGIELRGLASASAEAGVP